MYEGVQETCTVSPQGLKALLIKLHRGSGHTVFEPAGLSWLSLLLFSHFQLYGLSFCFGSAVIFFQVFVLELRCNFFDADYTVYTGYKWIFKQPLHKKAAWMSRFTYFSYHIFIYTWSIYTWSFYILHMLIIHLQCMFFFMWFFFTIN